MPITITASPQLAASEQHGILQNWRISSWNAKWPTVRFKRFLPTLVFQITTCKVPFLFCKGCLSLWTRTIHNPMKNSLRSSPLFCDLKHWWINKFTKEMPPVWKPPFWTLELHLSHWSKISKADFLSMCYTYNIELGHIRVSFPTTLYMWNSSCYGWQILSREVTAEAVIYIIKNVCVSDFITPSLLSMGSKFTFHAVSNPCQGPGETFHC